MYFTDTPELRKFEREMRQKPNFDRRNDECDENEILHFSDNKKLNTDRNKKEVGWFYDNKNKKSHSKNNAIKQLNFRRCITWTNMKDSAE